MDNILLKKHILRCEKHLLPILINAKRINIDDDYLSITHEDFNREKDKIRLPSEVVELNFKRRLFLVIDQYKNQVGYIKKRKVIVFSKLKDEFKDVTFISKKYYISNSIHMKWGLEIPNESIYGCKVEDTIYLVDKKKSTKVDIDENDEFIQDLVDNILLTLFKGLVYCTRKGGWV